MRRLFVLSFALIALLGLATAVPTAARADSAAASAAPTFLSTNDDTCMGSSGAGGQGDAFGFSVGSTWTDSNCIMLKNAREMKAQGHEKAAKARLCMDDDNAMAFELANNPCPRALESSQKAVATLKSWQDSGVVPAPQTASAPQAVKFTMPVPMIVAASSAAMPAKPGGIKDFIVNAGNRVFFGFDTSTLTPAAKRTLAKQVDWLMRHPAATALIEGHTDARGSDTYNLALGERRAVAMRDYLVSSGVASSRIQIVSYGENRPTAAGEDEAAWSQNRRGVTYILNHEPTPAPLQTSSLPASADVASVDAGADLSAADGSAASSPTDSAASLAPETPDDSEE